MKFGIYLNTELGKTYVFGQANAPFRYLTHGEYDFEANSYPSDHFMNSNDPYYYYMPPVLYSNCEFSYHDAHTCPYRAFVDATCASFEREINELTYQM